MAKKTYLLTIEYDSDTDNIEYLQEEVLVTNESDKTVIRTIDLEDKFDKKMLEYMREHYIVGET